MVVQSQVLSFVVEMHECGAHTVAWSVSRGRREMTLDGSWQTLGGRSCERVSEMSRSVVK
jgi:hypothetical protein